MIVTSTDSRYTDATVHVVEDRLTTEGFWGFDLFITGVVDSPEYGHDMVMVDGVRVKKDGTRSMQSRKPVVPLSTLPVEIREAMISERSKTA